MIRTFFCSIANRYCYKCFKEEALTHPGKFYISELNISLTKSLKGNKSQFLSAFIQESRLLEAIVESAS